MEEQGQAGMQGVFGILLVVGGIILIVLVLADLAGFGGGYSNALGQYNPAGAAKVQPPGSSVGLPDQNGRCPDGTVNIGGVCTVPPWNIFGGIANTGTLPPTAAPGSGIYGRPTAGQGTPGGCPPGSHSTIIGGRYPGCVKN